MNSLVLLQQYWLADPSDKNKSEYIRGINYYVKIGRLPVHIARELLKEVLKDVED